MKMQAQSSGSVLRRRSMATLATVAPAVMILAIAGRVNATVTSSGSDANSFGAFDSNIATNDLINIGEASLATAVSNTGANEGSLDGTHDGTGGQTATDNAWYAGGSTLTFTLNLNPGTGGSATGYDINTVNTFAGWPNNDSFADQVYLLQVATLNNPTFTTVQSVSYEPFTNVNSFPADPSSTEVSITSSSGPIATGVTGVRFILGTPTIFSQYASGTVWQELDVIGKASTPEPASIALIGLGAAGMMARRRRI